MGFFSLENSDWAKDYEHLEGLTMQYQNYLSCHKCSHEIRIIYLATNVVMKSESHYETWKYYDIGRVLCCHSHSDSLEASGWSGARPATRLEFSWCWVICMSNRQNVRLGHAWQVRRAYTSEERSQGGVTIEIITGKSTDRQSNLKWTGAVSGSLRGIWEASEDVPALRVRSCQHHRHQVYYCHSPIVHF